jgi:hypothetical protein
VAPESENRFTDEAARQRRGLISDVWAFLQATRKWWMLPIIAVFALFGVLMLIGGTAAAPFIYTLF